MTMSAGALARGLSLAWAAGVAWEYRGLAYPHNAWVFHVHTVVGSIVVVALVHGATASMGARGEEKVKRAQLLETHRRAMLYGAAPLSLAAAAVMLGKKALLDGRGWLLLSGRRPSLHSWGALLWIACALPAALAAGLAIHKGGVGSAGAFLKGLGFPRRVLAPLHRLGGSAALMLVTYVIFQGLTEKNDKSERKVLAWLLVVIVGLIAMQRLGKGTARGDDAKSQ